MNIQQLHLYRFRNYSEEKVSFSKGINLITGENGQGKTNLLEALHFCCLGHSPRTRKDKEMISWQAKDFILRIESENQKGETLSQSVQFFSNGKKTVQVKDRKSTKLSDLIGKHPVVFFAPSDLEIVNGPPLKRRGFLDLLLCQISEEYLTQLRVYRRVVRQKNMLLKSEGRFSSQVLEVLNEQLLQSGSIIIEKRMAFLKTLAPIVENQYAKSMGIGELKLKYQSGEKGFDYYKGEVKEELIHALKRLRSAEAAAKVSLVGPHRDNLLILLFEKPASDFGSQGQKRLISLCLKLASAKILNDKFQEPPVLLLDDVFAELDEKRRIEVSELVSHGSQVFLASPRVEDIPFHVDKTIFVNDGKCGDVNGQ